MIKHTRGKPKPIPFGKPSFFKTKAVPEGTAEIVRRVSDLVFLLPEQSAQGIYSVIGFDATDFATAQCALYSTACQSGGEALYVRHELRLRGRSGNRERNAFAR